MHQYILDELKSVSDSSRLEGMKRFAIATENALGVSLPNIRSIAKSINKNTPIDQRHQLAQAVWDTKIHEARILASMIDNPKEVTKKQMDAWTKEFVSWDLCDQVCGNLFQKTDFFLEKAFEYSYSKHEFVKRTGFVLMVQYAVHHKKESDQKCIEFLTRIEEEAWDERNFVRKATNWCLRQIGKRNKYLHPIAIACAERIQKQNSRAAKWIAADALRELHSDGVLKRLK
ncbi:MAG TPA: DNA alkylation repair protein [Chitinophagaceae bacterium]|jgi:3-methyladenine DNA glycosylase AlkD|nr:DNA alkylation repair protein [Chitinophagaceae bacterium]